MGFYCSEGLCNWKTRNWDPVFVQIISFLQILITEKKENNNKRSGNSEPVAFEEVRSHWVAPLGGAFGTKGLVSMSLSL